MLRFSRSEVLPPDRKSTRIADGAAAKTWLAGMSQPTSVANLTEIADVLRGMGASGVDDSAAPVPAERKFAIAERVRSMLMPMIGERSREDRFAALPLDDEFARHFWASIDAAIALRDAYAWLVSQLPRVQPLEDPSSSEVPGAPPVPAGSSPVSGIGALQRALDVDAQLLLAIQRARWPVPPQIWERHCVLGQLVRDLDCQDVEVADALRVSVTRTCRAAFAFPLMVALADPAARTSTEFEVVRMAAQRWSAKVGFRLERRTDLTTAPGRPIASPGPSVALGPHLVRFDTQSALQSIDRRLEALADGKSPREVGIGDALRPQAARDLLLTLKQRWGAVTPGEIDSPDRAWRNTPAKAPVLAVVGMPNRDGPAREAGKGAAKRGGASPYAYDRAKHDGITRPREIIQNQRVEQMLSTAETWTLAAESPDALRCIRKHGRPRIGMQRLIGLKLGTVEQDAPFLLGWVEALQGSTVEHDDGAVRQGAAQVVRVRLAPGMPQVLIASIDDVEVDCAFLLVPRTDAAQARSGRGSSRATQPGDSRLRTNLLANEDDEGWDPVRAAPHDYGLVLPLTSFRPTRLVKAVRNGQLAVLRLDELMMRGSDFDLVRFTLL